ncbi:MAG: DNA-directed RNA polymerase subunit alpha C-terminal domain-containing protein [Planctomycetota bacterium]
MEEVPKDLLRPLEELDLPVRAIKGLKELGATCLWDATGLEPDELLSLRNFGATTLDKLNSWLAAYGARVGSRTSAGRRAANPRDPDAPIVFTELSKRLRDFLCSEGFQTWREAAELTSAVALARPNLGAGTLDQLRAQLALRGLRLRDERLDDSVPEGAADIEVGRLGLSTRLRTLLLRLGVRTLEEAARYSRTELLEHPNVGATTLAELENRLREHGLHLHVGHDAHASAVGKPLSATAAKLNPEQALGRLAEEICSQPSGKRALEILAALVGWDGKGPKTLDAVGQAFGVTRERVRQIAAKAVKSLNARSIFRDRLMQALRMLATVAPCSVREASIALQGEGLIEEKVDAGVVLELADRLQLSSDVLALEIGTSKLIVRSSDAESIKKVVSSVPRQVDHWGAIAMEDLIQDQSANNASLTIPPEALTQVVSGLPGFEWLDSDGQWFWIKGRSRNRVVNRIRKILSVTDTLSLRELRAGVARDHCMEGFAPPRHVLAKMCESLPFAEVEGAIVRRAKAISRSVLGEAERKLVEILEANGGCMATDDVEAAAQRAGVGDPSIWRQLTYSSTITRPAPGTYALRGAILDPSQVVPPARRDPTKRRVVDSGWTSEGHPWVAMEVSRASLRRGIVTVPASLKRFVQGKWDVKLRDGRSVGELTVNVQSAWGLRAAFVRRGIDEGDVVILEWDTSTRRVLLVLGSDEALLAYQEGRASFWSGPDS